VFARNLLANWFGLIAEVVVALFLTPFIVSSLGLAVYGIWSLVNTLIGYLGLIDLGIRSSVGRYINHYLARRDDQRVGEVVSTSLLFLSAMSLVVLGIAYLVGIHFGTLFPKTPPALLADVAFLLPIMALNLWLAFVIAIFRNVLAALDRFDIANGINLVILAVRTLGVILVLQAGHGIYGLACVTLAANALLAGGMLIAASRRYPALEVSPALANRQRFTEIWRFGLTAFVTRSATQLVYQSGQVVVMYFLGPAAVGIYSIATMLVQNAQKLVEQIGATIYPSVMRAGSVKDYPALRSMFDWYARLSFFLAVLLYVGLIVFGGRFIALWVGPEFDAAVPVLQILAFAEIGALLTSTGVISLFSLDRIRFNLYVAMLEAVSNVIASALIVASSQSIVGAAIGLCVPMLLFRGLVNPVVCTRILNIPYDRYMLTIGTRVLALSGASAMVFALIERYTPGTGWTGFLLGVALASCLYLAPAATTMFGKQRLLQVLKKALP
jgi:O-antigen/teichoic acid export membrane protein